MLRKVFTLLFLFVSLIVAANSANATAGHVVTGVGAINQSVAGTSTAMPLDASGALYWNPATITGLDSSQAQINGEVMFVNLHLKSSVEPNAFGAGVPSTHLEDSTRSKLDIMPLPSFAYVYKDKNNKWATGVSANVVSGFGVYFPKTSTNPILTSQPPNGYGFGEIKTKYVLVQVSPAFAYKVTKSLSVGIAPVLDIASLNSSPFAGAVPDDANADGYKTYPNSNTSWTAGAGVQGGIYYENNGIHAGASLKSPQWMGNFHFKGLDELGNNRNYNFRLNFPMIASVGLGYSRIPKLKLMTDARYINYSNTQGFKDAGFDPNTSAVQGYGYKSIYIFSTGGEYEVNKNLSLRLGYSYNNNPIRDHDTFFVLGSPAIIQNHITAGATYKITDKIDVSLAYVLGIKNTSQGKFQSVSGPVNNTEVKTTMGEQSAVCSLRYKF